MVYHYVYDLESQLILSLSGGLLVRFGRAPVAVSMSAEGNEGTIASGIASSIEGTMETPNSSGSEGKEVSAVVAVVVAVVVVVVDWHDSPVPLVYVQ